jgi:hypothetical protein
VEPLERGGNFARDGIDGDDGAVLALCHEGTMLLTGRTKPKKVRLDDFQPFFERGCPVEGLIIIMIASMQNAFENEFEFSLTKGGSTRRSRPGR